MKVSETQDCFIPHRRDLDYKTFVNNYLRPRKPVIFDGALQEWDAVRNWTPQLFAERYGALDLVIDGRPVTMGNLITLILNADQHSSAPYLRNYPISSISRDLLQDIEPLPAYLRPNWLETKFHPAKLNRILGRAVIPDIFIGGACSSFPFLHYDLLNSHAFLCQIYGEKSYAMYSPDQTPLLYRSTEHPNRSQICNIESPNLNEFPRFAAARPIGGILRAGEMIFVPAGWWHTAKILSPSITVSINVANSSNWLGLIEDQYRNAVNSPKPLHRLAAAPLVAYLAGVGLYRSLVPVHR